MNPHPYLNSDYIYTLYRGWATALCAGNSGSGEEFNTIYSLFTCDVYLTVSRVTD